MKIDLGFETEMSFGKELHLGFEKDFNLKFSRNAVGAGSLVLSMNLLNTIPLDLTLQCLLLDDQDNKLASGSVDIMMNAGTIDEPTYAPAEIRFGTSSEGRISISKLRFNIAISSNERIQGNVMNTNQGFAIKDIVLTLPDGVTVDLTNLVGNEE